MNKKFLFPLMGAAALIGFTACQNDELMSDATGSETVVTFSAKLQNGQQTRAYADGSTAEVLKYVVYQAGTENAVYDITEVSIAGGSADVKLSLIKGQQYDIYFWADAEGSPYTFNGKTVDISYDGEVAANDETRDAFYASKLSYTASTGAQEVTLYRPFAQLNIGTADYDAVKSFFPLENGSVAVTTTVSSTINLTDGSAEGATQVVTFTGVGLAEGNFPLEGYTYLSMNYLFVGEDVTEDVTMVATAAGTTVENTFTAVPFKANYRTNIAGNLLTSTSDWKVTIDASFNTPANDVYVWDGESLEMPTQVSDTEYAINTPAQLAGLAALVNGTYPSATKADVAYESFEGMTFTLNQSIDLGNQDWTPIGYRRDYPFKGNFNGNGYTISNLKCVREHDVDAAANNRIGLFGRVGAGKIENFTLHNAELVGSWHVGAVCGRIDDAEFTNINVTGHVTIYGSQDVGGAFGYAPNAGTNISNITIDVEEGSYVFGQHYYTGPEEKWLGYNTPYVGGVLGYVANHASNLSNLKSNLTVKGSHGFIGGLIGYASSSNTLKDSSCSADVISLDAKGEEDAAQVGGLIGSYNVSVTVTNCEFTGKVTSFIGEEEFTNFPNSGLVGLPEISGEATIN